MVLPDLVEAWLHASPDLTVIATSQTPLGLPGAFRIPLAPLALDDAVALFVDRARRVAPGFTATRADLEQIVTGVDRIPRAIELLAARTRALPAAELGRRLDPGAELLGEPFLRSLDRTLRRLDPQEQVSLQALATFHGPFTLERAEAILGGDRALDRLQVLVDHGLVELISGARYRLLGLVRERVHHTTPIPDGLWLRHARWFARWARGWSLRPDPGTLACRRAAMPDLEAVIARWSDRRPDLVGPCAVALLSLWVKDDRLPDMIALGEEVSRLALEPSTLARILFFVSNAQLNLQQTTTALATMDRAMALPIDDATALLLHQAALLVLSYHEPASAEVEDRIRRARIRCAHLPLQERSLLEGRITDVWLRLGRPDRVDETTASVLDGVNATGDPEQIADATHRWGRIHAEQGRWLQAEWQLRRAWPVLLARDTINMLPWLYQLPLLQCQWNVLDLSGFDELVARHRRLGDPDPHRYREVFCAIARTYATGHAQALSLGSDWPWSLTGHRLPILCAEVQLLAGRIGDARLLLAGVPAEFPTTIAQSEGVQALIEAAGGSADAARAHLARAAAFYARSEVPVDHAVHLAMAALVEAKVGCRGRAAAYLEQGVARAAAIRWSPDTRLGLWLGRAEAAIAE